MKEGSGGREVRDSTKVPGPTLNRFEVIKVSYVASEYVCVCVKGVSSSRSKELYFLNDFQDLIFRKLYIIMLCRIKKALFHKD